MADPLLSSLCSICHISLPKYRCPRCKIRTCSVSCITKHKSWNDCTGERDPTVYVKPSRLRTAAGIDHDYNFLHGIEHSLERKEKILVGEKALVQEDELRPRTVEEVKWIPGKYGRKRKVLIKRELNTSKERAFPKPLANRLRVLNVRILRAPTGMARHRENQTSLNKKSGNVNWQIEWLTFGPKEEGNNTGAAPRTISRELLKVLDDVPIFQAHKSLQTQRAMRGMSKQQQKTMRERESQGASESKFVNGAEEPNETNLEGQVTQHIINGEEKKMEEGAAPQDLKGSPSQFDFFTGPPLTRSGHSSKITRLKPDDCLRNILANTEVLEFPSIYVLELGGQLPLGFVEGLQDTISRPDDEKGHKAGEPRGGERQQKWRKGPMGGRLAGGGSAAKKSVPGNLVENPAGSDEDNADVEEGEIPDDGDLEEEDVDDITSSSGSDPDTDSGSEDESSTDGGPNKGEDGAGIKLGRPVTEDEGTEASKEPVQGDEHIGRGTDRVETMVEKNEAMLS